ncbi:uncharacterized protein LOC135197289 isoform X2 [Macrobrachium nipponense]|uniref:uncharacterized protein LOC135197289 isoform X2 n=1 Tax=Macrobrachium nipponense TaxID=159736 RepID=UPI0030C7EB5B
MIFRSWGSVVVCLVVLRHILRTEGVPEYIHEGDCLLEQYMRKTHILSTTEDKLNLIIAKSNSESFYISVQNQLINLTDNLRKTFPSGLVPYELEFLEKGLTLVSLDQEYHWNWTSDVSLAENKEIHAKNVYVAKNCSQDLPYQKLAKDALEVVFPLSQDREQRFKMFLVKKTTVQFYFGDAGQEFHLHLCWDQKERKALIQNVTDENCNALPIVSPVGLNFFLNSSSHKVKVTNMNTSSFDYSIPRVTFVRGNNEGEVYIVQCLKECPKEDYTCDEFLEGTPTELLISLIVILSIANIAGVSVIIYQCKRQRGARGAQVHRDRETTTHGANSFPLLARIITLTRGI